MTDPAVRVAHFAQPASPAGVHGHQHLAAGNESLAAELARRQHAVRR